MICQNCKNKKATTYIKEVINGKLRENYLCEECANKMGVGAQFYFGGELGNFLSGFLGDTEVKQSSEICSVCGMSFSELSSSGKVGCANCYDKFKSRLLPVIQKIHGDSVHRGKRPGGSSMVISKKSPPLAVSKITEVERKKLLLKKAIEEQNFEEAAVLRDEIKELEQDE